MPKNNINKTPLKRTYDLSFQDSKSHYIVIVSKTKKNKLRIKILDYSEFHLTYQSDFDYDELLRISKFFWLFKDIESIIYEFDNLFLDEKVSLTLDLNHNIVMKFIIELNTRISFFLLRIENKDANKMKELGKIMALVEEQKGIIKELNKENRHLKRQMEKKGYKDEGSDTEEKSEIKDKTVSSFVPQNGSLYDKKLIKPKIEKKEEEKKEEKKEIKKEIKPKEESVKEEEKKTEDIITKEEEVKKEEIKKPKEKKEEKKKEEPKEEIKEEEPEKEKKSEEEKEKDLEQNEIKEDTISSTSQRPIPRRVIRENNIDIQQEIAKIVKKSHIFTKEREVTFLIDKINQNLNYRQKKYYYMRLIYRASEDGDTPYKFHRLCDGLSPLLVLIKTTYNKRFGGFTEAHFEASEDMIGKRSNTAFIFNLDREKAFDIIEGQNAICCHKNYGPVFYGYEYCNIYLVGNFLINEGNVARKGDRYKTTMDYEINDGRQKFVALEVEVYHIILTNC